jgi:hypothetical protein
MLAELFNIKMWDTYNKVKHKFKKPELHWRLGLWKNDPCLPMWRRGLEIRLGKYRKNYYCQNGVTHYKSGVSYWTDSNGKQHEIPCWAMSTHKVPCKYAWNRDIRIKLRKWGLSWIPPVVQLPMWLSFYVFNHDMIWKTKFEDYRFEFPPQFTIVFFGISLSFWLQAPVDKDDTLGYYSYWESILWYLNEYDLDENYKRVNKKWFK